MDASKDRIKSFEKEALLLFFVAQNDSAARKGFFHLLDGLHIDEDRADGIIADHVVIGLNEVDGRKNGDFAGLRIEARRGSEEFAVVIHAAAESMAIDLVFVGRQFHEEDLRPLDLEGGGAAIDHFERISTEGGTNYGGALAAARAAIAKDPDLDNSAVSPYYLVIFMSDGEPYPADPHVGAEVQAIMDVAPGRVSVNTVYFGPKVAEYEARLQSMSDVGKGRFFNTNVVGTKIDFATTAQLPSDACVQ